MIYCLLQHYISHKFIVSQTAICHNNRSHKNNKNNTAKKQQLYQHLWLFFSNFSCSSSDSDSEDNCSKWMEEMDRKRQHPLCLHPELWYNDPGEMNNGPLCRCSVKVYRFFVTSLLQYIVMLCPILISFGFWAQKGICRIFVVFVESQWLLAYCYSQPPCMLGLSWPWFVLRWVTVLVCQFVLIVLRMRL